MLTPLCWCGKNSKRSVAILCPWKRPGFYSASSTTCRRGEFVGNARPEQGCEPPTCGGVLLLILRSRSKGFGRAIEQVLKGIESRDDFSMRSLALRASRPSLANRRTGLASPSGIFSSPRKQIENSFGLSKSSTSTRPCWCRGLQGHGQEPYDWQRDWPPKTQVKSVLVTSHTTEALCVLRYAGREAPTTERQCPGQRRGKPGTAQAIGAVHCRPPQSIGRRRIGR